MKIKCAGQTTIVSNRGFSLIELVVVLVLSSIIGSYVVVSLNKSISYNKLQKTSFNVLSHLSSQRSIALKEDTRILVKFSVHSCSVYVDRNCDTVGQADEFSSSWELPDGVVLGLPVNSPPTNAPSGSVLPQSGQVAGGAWAKGLLVLNDALGTINPGCVYLHYTKLPKVTYCISSYSTQSLKVFNWDGTSWNAH